jgi:hypothetical protein
MRPCNAHRRKDIYTMHNAALSEGGHALLVNDTCTSGAAENLQHALAELQGGVTL